MLVVVGLPMIPVAKGGGAVPIPDVTKVTDSDGAVHDRIPVDEEGGAVQVRIGEGAIVANYDEGGDETPVPDKSGVMASSVEYEKTDYMEMVVTMSWNPDTKHDTNKERIKYVGKEIGALGVFKLSAGQSTQLFDFCLTNNIP